MGGALTESDFFLRLTERRLPVSNASPLLAELRAKADARLQDLSQPDTSNEEWRFTNLRTLYRTDLSPAEGRGGAALLEQNSLPESEGAQIVFVNGQFNEALTDLSAVADAVSMVRFSQADAAQSERILQHVNHHVRLDNDAFLRLNTALLTDGVWIDIPKNAEVTKPIHMLFITDGQASFGAPRVLVTAGRHARAVVVEESVGNPGHIYLNLPVLEFDLERGAHLTHVKVQRESFDAFHVGRVGASIARDGHYESYSVQIGAKISRNDVVANQTEEQMFATLDGLVLIAGDQLSDTHTLMDHAKPYGESHQLHKCLVDGKATSVFNGKIFVRQDAQKVNSFQENRNLLLSQDGTVHTKPQLEIFADDVKCSHGATVGQLRDEELFYLKSRGLDDRSSRELLTQAFAFEVIDNIPVESLRERLAAIVSEFTHTTAEVSAT